MKEMNEVLDVRKVLLGLCVDNKGDWDGIYADIKSKKPLSKSDLERVNTIDETYITVVDDNYPTYLKDMHKPSFVLFYRGKLELLDESRTRMLVLNDNLASNYSNETITNISKGVVDKVVFVVKFGTKKEKELIKVLVNKGAELVVVLNSGIDDIEDIDKELYETLCNNHLVISEYPYIKDIKSKKTELNSLRLAVALSKCVLMGGITRKSIYYAGMGFALSKDLMMMSIPFNAGTNYINNKMIKHGVELVENEKDVIALLNML